MYEVNTVTENRFYFKIETILTIFAEPNDFPQLYYKWYFCPFVTMPPICRCISTSQIAESFSSYSHILING